MASQRLIIAFFLVAAVIVCSLAKNNNLIVGSRVYGDYQLGNSTRVFKDSTFLTVHKITKTFVGDNFSTITQVRLLDLNKHEYGANATILNGGVGNNFVTVQFKSQRGHKIDYIVELYGKRF